MSLNKVLPPNVYDAEPIPTSAMAEVERILASGDLFRYTNEDSPVARLEADFAEMLGVRYALAISSCSAALFLSLKAMGLPRDARVLIPAFTFAAVPSSIVHANCIPLLAECGEDYRIDMEDFARKLPEVQAIIISHMRGHTSDMDAIMALCDAAGVPVIEDAAHSLGTTWGGRNIGTLGRVGCFSFQSYKLMNAGEGGMLITDDDDLFARAVIMSGAYEHNWKKHPMLTNAFASWQNKLPLYNMRLNNLSAVILRPQLAELPRRVADGRRNYDHVKALLNQSPWITVPDKLGPELRAPDSIQFNLEGMTQDEIVAFIRIAEVQEVKVQVFGASRDNARAFWNWEFLGSAPYLPRTRAMLMRACDVRLPARLTRAECEAIAEVLTGAAEQATAAHAG
jgi:dTDP-4-amino-4,6-dideoxygalactose transaminase